MVHVSAACQGRLRSDRSCRNCHRCCCLPSGRRCSSSSRGCGLPSVGRQIGSLPTSRIQGLLESAVKPTANTVTCQQLYIHPPNCIYMASGHSVFNLCQCTKEDMSHSDASDPGLAGSAVRLPVNTVTRQQLYIHPPTSVYMASGQSLFYVCQCMKVDKAPPHEPDPELAGSAGKPLANTFTRHQL